MSTFVLSQILIGIVFLFDVASFQFKKRERTLACLTVAASFLAIHFFLLGATTAGFLVAISAARFLISIFTTNVWVKYACLTAIVAFGLYTFDGVEDIFALFASSIGTFAAFQKDERLLRILMMFGTSSYIIHNLLIWTPAGIAIEIFFLTSNLISYYRFYLKTPKT